MRNTIIITKFSILALLCGSIVALCILHDSNRATITTNITPHYLPNTSQINHTPNHYAVAPKILGIDNNNRQYSITADYVTQEKGIILMYNAQANIPINDNLIAIITAKHGKILINTHKAFLYSSTLENETNKNNEVVSIKLGNYGTLQAEYIEVLYEEGKIFGKNNVQLRTKFGSVSGDNFIIDNTENTIQINGHAYTTITYNKSPIS